MNFKHRLLLSCALVAATATVTGTAAAQSRAVTSAAASNTIEELVVTAERREQSLQDVPIAISAFTSEKRDLVGINSVQDLTNFTPGLNYSTASDRISLRGVGRLTNAHPIDSGVATYSDNIYTTSTTEAGKTPILMDRIEVLPGPQGTLYGRNSIGGVINVISRRPTEEPYAEVRATIANFQRTLFEAAVSGPLADGLQYRLAGTWEKQRKGYYDNIVPGMPDEGNVIDQFYLEGQLQAQMFDNKLEGWVKIGINGWNNGGGGPGSRGGYSPTPFSYAEFGLQNVNAGFACAPPGNAGAVVTNVVNTSPLGCVNPATSDPRKFANNTRQSVSIDESYTAATQFTYHFDGADLKYIGGGSNYHYTLIQDNGGGSITSFQIPIRNPAVSGPPNPTCSAAAQAAKVCGPLTVFPRQASTYQEKYWNISHELNLASNNDSNFQWLGGLYYYKEGYDQPVFTTLFDQPQLDGPIRASVPAITCPGAPATQTCLASADFQRRLYDDRPTFEAESYAAYGQVDWQFTPTLKTTLGLRYSHDKKTGTEAVRIVCFATTTCGITPELFGSLSVPVDVTAATVYTGGGQNITPRGVVPNGNLGGVTFDSFGFAHRDYDASWEAWTGTAGLQWDPDPDTMTYARYSRGYKAGGINSGITTTLGQFPFTNSEHMDSYSVGLKKNFGRRIQTNVEFFYYNYDGLQAPLTVANNTGALAASQTRFENVPKAVSQGIELQTLWAPIDNLQIVFNYSYNDAHIKDLSGIIDSDDPLALSKGAKPLTALAACTGTGTTVTTANPRPNPLCDVNTGFVQRPQDLSGNSLPQAAKNKVAVNVSYTWDIGVGSLTPSVSYIWRDKEYSGIFQRETNASKAWDQVDARVLWKGPENRYTVIAYVKNVFDQLGYAGGAGGARTTGTFAVGTPGVAPGLPAPVPGTTFGVQGGPRFTYALTPPRTYGVELQYRF